MATTVAELIDAQKEYEATSIEFRRAKKAYNRMAQEITDVQWLELVSQIEDESARRQVASIVWWDYISKHKDREGWTALDELRMAWRMSDAIPLTALRAALRQVGYPVELAHYRTRLEQGAQSEAKKGGNTVGNV